MSKQPPPNPFINFYHPNSPEVKSIKRDAEDYAQQEARLRQQGWTRDRFAQAMYHKRSGQKVARSREEVATLKKSGWQEAPITDPAEAKGAHPDAVHPHHNDEHRQAMLAETAAAKK